MAEKDTEKKQKDVRKPDQKQDSKQEAKQAKALNEKIEKLEKELEEARKEAEEGKKALEESKAALAKEKDDYLRLRADVDNIRRRTAQEKLDLVSVASQDTIKGLLPVLDDCERAMKLLADSTDSQAAKEGTELIYNKLMSYLKTKGLAVIDAMGKPFDTEMHEAVAQFPVQEEEKKGKVFDVCVTGYTLNGKVIRFAKVVVGI